MRDRIVSSHRSYPNNKLRIRLDPQGLPNRMNDAWYDFYDCPRNEFGFDWHDFVWPDHHSFTDQQLELIALKGRPAIYTNLSYNRKNHLILIRWMVSPIIDRYKNFIEYSCVGMPMQDRRIKTR